MGFSRRPPFVGVYPFHSGFFSKRQDDSAKILEFRAKKRQDGKKAVWREKQEGAVEWNLCRNYIMYIRGSTLAGIVMPIVIIAILGIALVLYARKRNSDEIRRIREKAERDAALYEQRPEREAREVEERCAGRPVDEQVRMCEEFSARLEADMKRHEARAREIEKARKAAEEARSKEYDMSPGTKGALLFMAGAAVGSMTN